MKLYHGTNGDKWKEFYQHGIRPRGAGAPGNFNGAGHPNAVYLTSSMAPAYSSIAPPGDLCGVIEISDRLLNLSLMRPDTDYLNAIADLAVTQFTPAQNHQASEKRTHEWQSSLSVVGQVAYMGRVPPKSFTRVALFPRTVLAPYFERFLTIIDDITFMRAQEIFGECTEYLFSGENPDVDVQDAPSVLQGFKTIRAGVPLEPLAAPLGIDYAKILKRACERFALPCDSIHGPKHWAKVEEIGLRLAHSTGADVDVVRLFAALHDVERREDGEDPEHGQRAAQLATRWRTEGFELHKLDESRFLSLYMACQCHAMGLTSEDATIGTCWDADRLDLGRVGITPSSEFLSTRSAQDGVR
jgi:uncharacterized protein